MYLSKPTLLTERFSSGIYSITLATTLCHSQRNIWSSDDFMEKETTMMKSEPGKFMFCRILIKIYRILYNILQNRGKPMKLLHFYPLFLNEKDRCQKLSVFLTVRIMCYKIRWSHFFEMYSTDDVKEVARHRKTWNSARNN